MNQTDPCTELDLLNVPLEGCNLIEASAGTGKTYTISRLFIRLLLERELDIGSLLVVTFTEAATQELKERIFSTLRTAIHLFATGNAEITDPFLGAVAKRVQPARALDLLNAALREFDRVAIHTIHGFCRRVLFENAFESGVAFDTQVITDQQDLLREIAEDFWRIHFYQGSELLVSYALTSGVSPESFLDLFQFATGPALPRVLPQSAEPDTAPAEAAFRGAFDSVARTWPDVRPEIVELLASPSLSKTSYSASIVDRLVAGMDSLVGSATPDPLLFEEFTKFTAEQIRAATKKKCSPPEHRFFTHCQELLLAAKALAEQLDRKILHLRSSFLLYAHQQLTERKERQNLLYFDDLLIRVQRAILDRERGPALVARLRNTYHAALVDEFQDTDPVQYAIFDATFGRNSTLFLIGDPKQAIYSFRGADVFTYLAASGKAERKYTLRTNYRSDEDLVRAVNRLFGQAARPFVFDGIRYEQVKAGVGKGTQLFEIDGVREPPLRIWVVERPAGDSARQLTKGDAQSLIAQRIAAEIARLVLLGSSQRASIGSFPVAPSDIAVLVRTNREADLVKSALSACDVPAVIDSNSSVFTSPEAVEIERLLSGILEPNRPDLVRAALATQILGYDSAAIEALAADEAAWGSIVESFAGWHDLWRSRGFMAMFRHILTEWRVPGRLLSGDHGERRMTNVLHIAELIHTRQAQAGLGMASLLKWLSDKIVHGKRHAGDEEIMRLESDDCAVRIVTVHKSKGLEYPIVFCPYAWGGSKVPQNRSGDPFLVHDPVTREPLLVLGADEITRMRPDVERESLAENMRLLYVALTRAKACCYLVCGSMGTSETSAPSYLMHGNGIAEPLVEALAQKVGSIANEALWGEIRGAISGVEDAAAAERFGAARGDSEPSDGGSAPTEVLKEREFHGTIAHPWRITSFSGLTSTRSTVELPDHDAVAAEAGSAADPSESSAPGGMFAFPRGARAGTFLHDLLERIDFTRTADPATDSLIEERLRVHGFAPDWLETLRTLLGALGACRPVPHVAFRFGDLHRGKCLTEMEFYFPLRRLTPEELRSAFAAADVQTDLFRSGAEYTAQGIEFSPVKGFMKGFIDLVFEHGGRFYLVDWKSNFLGPAFSDYTQAPLARAMCHEHYVLQYHIYLAALHRHLTVRKPGYRYERDFGGVIYVFLRGLGGPTAGTGIYFDRPRGEFVEHLSRVLIDDCEP